MAFAAVFFAVPFALASATLLWALNGLGVSEAALIYLLSGFGSMGVLFLFGYAGIPADG